LTAHHAQDQAETLLLQLLRGAGLKGLSAMPLCRRFAQGWHLRPLITVTPRAIAEFSAGHGIEAIDDPMNRDARFDRAYLRTCIWPALEQRWPGAAVSLARTAHHLADAQQLLDQTSASNMSRLRDGEALSVSGLRALGVREQVSTLRHWLRDRGVTPPSTSRLAEALRQVMTAQTDHLPAIVWDEYALRRYRARLFITRASVPTLDASANWRIAPGSRLPLGESLGALRWVRQPGGFDAKRLPEVISVRRRRGGEMLKVNERARTQSVQHLCQRMGVLPWMRDALPMLYAGDVLIAIGDLWQDARWRVGPHAPGIGCVWEDAPTLT
jgi:tRNA(Ile)-lysidine synthase